MKSCRSFLKTADLNHAPQPARMIPTGRLQKSLIKRHRKNRQLLLEASEFLATSEAKCLGMKAEAS